MCCRIALSNLRTQFHMYRNQRKRVSHKVRLFETDVTNAAEELIL